MAETQVALEKVLKGKYPDAAERAERAVAAMQKAFPDAMVSDYGGYLCSCEHLPDKKDAHVLAAALKIKADTLVTENLKDFPEEIIRPLNIEIRSADAFIADTIDLDQGRAVAAIKRMRDRFKSPEKTADLLLVDMEAAGLTETVDVLRPHILSL